MSMHPGHSTGPEVVLREERAHFQTEREAVRAVVRRRITSQTQLVEVTVRREVLEVEYLPVADASGLVGAAPSGPVVMVLSEEVPEVSVVTRPYERVTVDVERTHEPTEVEARVSRERADVLTD